MYVLHIIKRTHKIKSQWILWCLHHSNHETSLPEHFQNYFFLTILQKETLLLFVVVFSSFLLLVIFSSVTRVKGFTTQAIWLLIISCHGWKSNTTEWLNSLKPHTNCIFCSPEMSSECWLRKQKFVENSFIYTCSLKYCRAHLEHLVFTC